MPSRQSPKRVTFKTPLDKYITSPLAKRSPARRGRPPAAAKKKSPVRKARKYPNEERLAKEAVQQYKKEAEEYSEAKTEFLPFSKITEYGDRFDMDLPEIRGRSLKGWTDDMRKQLEGDVLAKFTPELYRTYGEITPRMAKKLYNNGRSANAPFNQKRTGLIMPAGRVQAWIQKVANKYYKQVDPDYLDKVTISKEAKDYIQMMLESIIMSAMIHIRQTLMRGQGLPALKITFDQIAKIEEEEKATGGEEDDD